MKVSSVLTAFVASASLAASSVALADYTMTGATATQKLTVSGCKAQTTTITVDAVFANDGSYTIEDSSDSSLVQAGTWTKVDGKNGAYTLYLASNVYAPGPYNDEDPDDGQGIPPEGDGSGSLDNFIASFEASVAGMTCTIKAPGTQVADLLESSALIKKSSMAVKSDGAGKLTFQISGKQTNDFKGPPAPGKFAKAGSFSATMTIEGTVTGP